MQDKFLMPDSFKIMIADDDESIRFAFDSLLKRDNYLPVLAEDGEDAVSKTIIEKPDMIFLDIAMPKLDGLEALKKLRRIDSSIPVIVITGAGTMQTAVKAIQNGAFDYLTKPIDISKVREVIKKARLSRKTQPQKQPHTDIFRAEIPERYEIVGNSSSMQDVYKMIGSISTTPNYTSVLIIGESGTGKELVARAIHNHGPNANEPFIAVNCTALPENLLESELFGHEKGSFTGAIERKIGKFEAAGAGTIFLDEISSLAINIQQKLLRVLQQRELDRVGGLDTIPIRARFIAASNTDIDSEVKKGNFREDLFYRINIAVVYIAPLRERKEDIPLLASYFLAKYNFHMKKNIKGFSKQAVQWLSRYDYPGNVRELENLIERAVMLSKGDVILSDHLQELVSGGSDKQSAPPVSSDVFSAARESAIGSFEIKFLQHILKKTHGNVTEASRLSQMSRQNLQRLMKKYHIRSEDYRDL